MRHFTQALDIGKKAALRHGTVKSFLHFAVAMTPNGHIIKTAANKKLEGDHQKLSEHAEAALVRKLEKIKAMERYGVIDVFVGRITKHDGKSVMSKPCPRCAYEMKRYGINRVYYTTGTGC